MKKFDKYLKAIDVPQNIKERVYEILEISKRFLNANRINDIYISEYMSENSREFESVWIYTDNFISEAKNFRNAYNLDKIQINCKFSYANIMYENYDFVNQTAMPQSRMTLNVRSNIEGLTCVFKGTGKNCEYLHSIFNKYYRDI